MGSFCSYAKHTRLFLRTVVSMKLEHRREFVVWTCSQRGRKRRRGDKLHHEGA